MYKMLSVEYRKMISGRTLLVSISLGVLISIINVIENQSFVTWFLEGAMIGTSFSTINLYVRWIGVDQLTLGSSIFFFIFPLLAAIPYSWSYLSEKQQGYTNHILVRAKQKNYFVAKYIMVFFSGTIAVVIPIIINFALNALVCPNSTPHVLNLLTPIGQGSFFSKVFYQQPLLYCVAACFLYAFWGGVCAVVALTVSLFVKKPLFAMMSPFVFAVGGDFLRQLLVTPTSTTKFETSPLALIRATSYNMNPAWYLISIILGLILATFSIVYLKGSKNEIL